MELIIKPWDRRDNESDQAYDAFQRYLKLPKRGDPERTKEGPRRFVSDLSRQLNKRNQTLNTWFLKHEWEERAAAYDAFMCCDIQPAEAEDDDRELAKDLRDIAKRLRDKAIESFDTLNITNVEDAVRVLKLANECDEKARKIDKPESEGKRAELIEQIKGVVGVITSGVGGMAGRGPGGTIVATERTIRIDSSGNRREDESVCPIPGLPGDICKEGPGSELVV